MNQFRVKATKYSAAGALTSEYVTFSYATAALAREKYDELKRMKQVDDDGNPTYKMYEVKLEVMVYKPVENVDEFFAMFDV